jgi:glycosyltransferase involved in cell wall biosynthesis
MIDICIPYWGDPGLMRKTVESVLAQDSDRWTLTVLDDAYSDRSVGEWMATLNHPRVRYFRNEKNLGIVGNYQKLLTMISHEMVMLLGCDDELMPNYVNTILIASERHPTAGIIHPGVVTIDENGREIKTLTDWAKTKLVMPKAKDQLLGGESLAISLLKGDWMYWPALAFKSAVIKQYEFNPKLKLTHDLAIVMDMVLAGEKMLIVQDVCFSYRRHSKSASTASLMDGRRFSEERQYFNHAKSLVVKKGWTGAKRAVDWHVTSRFNALWICLNAIARGQWKDVPHLMGHAFGQLK